MSDDAYLSALARLAAEVLADTAGPIPLMLDREALALAKQYGAERQARHATKLDGEA